MLIWFPCENKRLWYNLRYLYLKLYNNRLCLWATFAGGTTDNHKNNPDNQLSLLGFKPVTSQIQVTNITVRATCLVFHLINLTSVYDT